MSRTVSKFVRFIIGDSANTLRHIPINTLSVVGVEYDEEDVTAWADAVRGALANMPNAPIEFGGPFDMAIAAVSPTLSGSHTVLAPLNGLLVPRDLRVEIGMRRTPSAVAPADPVFAITGARSDTNGYLIVKYTVDPSSMTYTAKAVVYPGSALPSWQVMV